VGYTCYFKIVFLVELPSSHAVKNGSLIVLHDGACGGKDVATTI
jgi:hypothetical protein